VGKCATLPPRRVPEICMSTRKTRHVGPLPSHMKLGIAPCLNSDAHHYCTDLVIAKEIMEESIVSVIRLA